MFSFFQSDWAATQDHVYFILPGLLNWSAHCIQTFLCYVKAELLGNWWAPLELILGFCVLYPDAYDPIRFVRAEKHIQQMPSGARRWLQNNVCVQLTFLATYLR